MATLERLALPFGNAWHHFIGARSIKLFPVRDDLVGISYVMVTADAFGRLGVLWRSVERALHAAALRLSEREAGRLSLVALTLSTADPMMILALPR